MYYEPIRKLKSMLYTENFCFEVMYFVCIIYYVKSDFDITQVAI